MVFSDLLASILLIELLAAPIEELHIVTSVFLA